MAAAQDDDDFGMFLAYSPTTASLARHFGYIPPALQLPSLAPSLSPSSDTPPHLRNISSAGVGLASISPQQQQQQPRRYAPYKGTPTTGPLLSLTPTPLRYSERRTSPMSSDGTPPSIGVAGVGLFSPSPVPSPPQQLGMTPRRAALTPLIGAAGVGLSSSLTTPPFSSRSTTPRRHPVVRTDERRKRTGTSRGSTTSSARSRVSRVSRIRHTPTTRRRVQSLQRSADNAIRGRRIAAVTETRTVTTTYKGNNQRPRVTGVSTRQTSPYEKKTNTSDPPW